MAALKPEDFRALVAAYFANTHDPAKELVLRRFADGSDDDWFLLAGFYVAPDAARLMEASRTPCYRYVRLGVQGLPGRRFTITFIQEWRRGQTVAPATLHEEVFDYA